MTFARVNAIGWAQYELLTAAQMNSLDTNVSRALDGYAGGVYTPSLGLVLDGAAISTGYTFETRPTTAGAGYRALQDASQSAITTSAQASASQAGAVAPSVVVAGTANSAGPGGAGVQVTAGAGGPSGPGGYGAFFTGGAGASGQAGGPGVYAIGGVRRGAYGNDRIYGHGVVAVGGAASQLDVRPGAGVFGVGGASTSGYGGPGAVFDGGAGTDSSAGGIGVVGHGYGATGYTDYGQGGEGGQFYGGPSGFGGLGIVAVGGDGATGGGGAYLVGKKVGVGVRAAPGASGTVAVQSDGGIDFDSAGNAARKNPVATIPQKNKLFAKNTIKAWGWVVDGVLVAGFNVASVAINATTTYYLDVTLAQAMASTDYGVICSSSSGMSANSPRLYSFQVSAIGGAGAAAPTTTTFQLHQVGAISGNTVDWSSSSCIFMVIGEQ